MELEEMKNLWDEMSQEIEKQKVLTDKLIISMTQQQFGNRLRKIIIPEVIGSVTCLAGMAFILINFEKLDTWYLTLCGIISAGILLLLPMLSIKAIYKMQRINMAGNSYKQTFIDFTKGKTQFKFVQKLNAYLGFILLLVILPVTTKIMGNKDILFEGKVWLWYLPSGALIFFVFTRWVYHYYIKTTTEAENILKELEG